MIDITSVVASTYMGGFHSYEIPRRGKCMETYSRMMVVGWGMGR